MTPAFLILCAALTVAQGTNDWRLVMTAPAAEDARSAEARSSGAIGEAAIPACQRVSTGLMLCVSRSDVSGKIAMIADLTEADTTLSTVLQQAKSQVEARWSAQPAGTHNVEGMKGRYFVRAAGDGFDAAALLRPDLLADLAGGKPVVAVPEDGTVLWWVPGDADFDKVVAVGVRRMVDASAVPVSPRIYSWDPRTEAWTVWGEVRGTVDLPVPAAASAPIP